MILKSRKKKVLYITVAVVLFSLVVRLVRGALRKWKGPFWDENDYLRRLG